MMVKKILLILFLFLFYSYIYSQVLCEPIDLEVASSNSTLQLDWKDIGGGSDEWENIFLECFEECGIPSSATIVHEVDNGNGGWYRTMDAEYYCYLGADCELNSPDGGWSALGAWAAPYTPIDSRMIFGPFQLPQNSFAKLEFLEAYIDGEYMVDQNLVEISTDGGQSWQGVYTSNGDIGVDWVDALVDLSEYSGQTIHVSFRYQCSEGWTEAWLVDHIGLYIIDAPTLITNNHELNVKSINHQFAKNKFKIDRQKISSKAKDKRIRRENIKPNYFIPVPEAFVHQSRITEYNQALPNNRDCADPENETEISLVMTESYWSDEISWSIIDSLSGLEVLSGVAPDDTITCLPNGWYTLLAEDSYGDGWDIGFLTITDISGNITFLQYTLPWGTEGSQSFYIGEVYGCMDPFADNFNPLANIDDGSCEYTVCEENDIWVYCSPGNWPSEVSWYIEDSIGSIVTNGVADDLQLLCLPDGDYKVAGIDSYGDGWNDANLTVADADYNVLLQFTFDTGFIDSATFHAGPIYGCTDPQADNYDPEATVDDSTCTYTECYERQGYIVYLDGDSIDLVNINSYTYENLENGKNYALGVSTIYNEGSSIISSISSTPWGNIQFDPTVLVLDTLPNESTFDLDFAFSVSTGVSFTTPFYIDSPKRLDVDYESSILYSGFNSSNFTNMFDPSGIFGGLWQIGDQDDASSAYFSLDRSLDTTSFAWINDDMIGAAGGAESAYLITEEVTVNPGDRIFLTLDVYFPQPFGSCSAPDAGVDGEGFSEDLFLMISSDYGENWSVVDSVMGNLANWVSRMYEVTDELDGATSFIAALYYTDCNGNWAFGVGVDNFAIHVAGEDELIAIAPYAGWVEAGTTMPVTMSVSNNQESHSDTYLELSAAFEDLNIPVSFGLTLHNDNDFNTIPKQYVLYQNYPNPFNPSTTIPFQIPNNEPIQLTIYNILGEKINTLVNQRLVAGKYEIGWNGISDTGHLMPAGLYFYELRGNKFRDTGKMVFLK